MASSAAVKTVWTKIERHLISHLPDVHAALRPPADPRAIEAAEAALSLKFPELLAESLAIHDGMNAETLFELWRLLPVNEIVEQWRSMVHLLDAGEFADCGTTHDKKVGDGWFRREWLPFAADGCGNMLCVDLAPGPRGKLGQVICCWHDDGERKVESADLLSWFRRVARDLPTSEGKSGPKPVIVGEHAFRNVKAAQICAVRGQTDLAMSALRGFHEQGDASAAAALSLLHAFRGQWNTVVDLSAFVLANSSAFHHMNVPYEHCLLLARAGVHTGRWSDIARAAKGIEPGRAGNGPERLAESAHASDDRLNVAYAEERSDAENVALYSRYLAADVPSTYSQTDASRRRHHFLMARNYRRIDVARRLIAEDPEVSQLDDTVALAQYVNADELWPVVLSSLQRWYPVYTAQVAPAELITAPFVRDMMTRDRCEAVLATPRVRHWWDFRRPGQ